MTVEELAECFETYDDEYLKDDRVDPSRRLHVRCDIDAFLRLHSLVPGKCDMVSCSEHDEFYLDTYVEELAKNATDEDIIDLIRCGVRYDVGIESLCMFV